MSAVPTKSQHDGFKCAVTEMWNPGGMIEKAREAAANGTLGDFFKQLFAQFGPILGQILVSLLAGLIHVPTP